MVLTHNEFKSTTIAGTLHNINSNDGTQIAEAIFDGNVTVSKYLLVNEIANVDNSFFDLIQNNLFSGKSHLGYAWNNPGSPQLDHRDGYFGESNFINYSQGSSNLSSNAVFRFYNVSSSSAPVKLFEICNNGFVFCNGINNINSNQLNYLLNVSSDIQNQLDSKTTLANVLALNYITINDVLSKNYTTLTNIQSNDNNFTGLNTFTNILIKSSTFPTTTSSLQGLSVGWNKSGGSGEVDFICYGQGGISGFRFYGVSQTLAPTLFAQILNTGFIVCNGVNSISSTVLNYLLGVSSNIQTQLDSKTTLAIVQAQNYIKIADVLAKNYITMTDVLNLNYSGLTMANVLALNYTTLSNVQSNINTFTSLNTFSSVKINDVLYVNEIFNIDNSFFDLILNNTPSSKFGLGYFWNNPGSPLNDHFGGYLGESNFVNYCQGSSNYPTNPVFRFYNVSNTTAPNKLFEICNNGFVFCNGINNINSTKLNYLLNLTSDIQNQLDSKTTLTNIQNQNYTTLAIVQAQNYIKIADVTNLNYTTLATVQAQNYIKIADVTNLLYLDLTTLIQLGYKTLAQTQSVIYSGNNSYSGSNSFSGSIVCSGNNTFLGNNIIDNALLRSGTFPTSATSTYGLSVTWNRSGNLGECDLICNADQGAGGFRFYSVSRNYEPILLFQIENSGNIICNSLNSISSTKLNYLINVSSDIQTQINTKLNASQVVSLINNGNNSFTAKNTFDNIIMHGSNFPTGPTIEYGLGVTWNHSGGSGEVDLIAYNQGADRITGFNFYGVNSTMSPKLLCILDSPTSLTDNNTMGQIEINTIKCTNSLVVSNITCSNNINITNNLVANNITCTNEIDILNIKRTGGEIPKYDSGWFAVFNGQIFTLNLSISLDSQYPPRYTLLFSSDVTNPDNDYKNSISTNPNYYFGDITGQISSSNGYLIAFRQNVIKLQTGTGYVGYTFNGNNTYGFTNFSTGKYRLLFY
jgi:hypothetical protein